MKLKSSTGDTLGTVTKVSQYESELSKGVLAVLEVPGYGETHPFYFENGMVTASEEERRKKLSGIPVEYMSKEAKDFNFSLYGKDMSKQKEYVNTFILRFREKFLTSGNNLYIFSKEKGTGKTMLACVIANEIMKRYGYAVKYITAQEYIEKVQTKKTEEIEAYKNCTLLILDDIGSETSKKDNWTTKPMFNLIDWRYTNHYSTIFTSNFGMEELEEDSRTIDRINSSSVPILIPDVPIRRNQGKEYIARFMKDAMTEKGQEKPIFE